jgi:major type 1 subunit fimbrin (pilin)
MNKALLSTVLAVTAIASGALAFAPTARAATPDGTVTFQGKVLSSTCTVSNASGGNVAVTLPDVVKTAFTGQGSVAGLTPFSLNLTGCPTTPSGVKVAAQFSGTTIDASTGALTNGTGTGMSNVEVQMTDGSGNPINLSSNNTPVNATIGGTGAATLGYEAQYFQPTATAVTAGSVNTSVNFTLVYN